MATTPSKTHFISAEACIAQLRSIAPLWLQVSEVEKEKRENAIHSVVGLLNECQVALKVGVSRAFISKMRVNGLIRPRGYLFANGPPSAYYHPSQLSKIKMALGITLDSIEGLLTEAQVANLIDVSLCTLQKNRMKSAIRPHGHLRSRGGLKPYYHPDQIEAIQRLLMPQRTYNNDGLLGERDFAALIGVTTSAITRYRTSGTLKPRGCGYGSGGKRFLYHPDQAKALRKLLGITLESVAGLLSIPMIGEILGVTPETAKRLVERCGIRPAGRGMGATGVHDFYERNVPGRIKKKLGITITKHARYLTEAEFKKRCQPLLGTSRVEKYREKGLLRPAGFGISLGGVVPYYKRSQVQLLKRKLGITLESPIGLLHECAFAKECGISSQTLQRFRRAGIIKPTGYHGMNTHGPNAYYHPNQIKATQKQLRTSLSSPRGLVDEKTLAKLAGVSVFGISNLRQEQVIKPVGFYGRGGRYPRAYYKRTQAKWVRARFGLTLRSVKGLIKQAELARRLGMKGKCVRDWVRAGLVKPAGWAYGHQSREPYYRPSQVRAIQRQFGFTLNSIAGLLSETKFAALIGLSVSAVYRRRKCRGLRPFGYFGRKGTEAQSYYHPRQVAEFRRKVGITLPSTTGLLDSRALAKATGISVNTVLRARIQKLIIPVGIGLGRRGPTFYYRSSQVSELRKKLGITLSDTRGLISEADLVERCGIPRGVVVYRRDTGRLKPEGYAMESTALSAFYRKEVVQGLRNAIPTTVGLVSERDMAKTLNVNPKRLQRLRRLGHLSPQVRGSKSYFYRKDQETDIRRMLYQATRSKAS